MDWIRIPVARMRSPEVIGSEPTDRATWLCLLVYCAEQESGGRIVNCRGWGDRRWMQTCGVTLEEVGRACELWQWDGDDLVVHGYPQGDEDNVRAKREAGFRGGKSRSTAKLQASRDNGRKRKPSKSQAALEAEAKQKPSKHPTEQSRAEESRAEQRREYTRGGARECSLSEVFGDEDGPGRITEQVPDRCTGSVPPDLPPRLVETWQEIARADGVEIAGRALEAARRIFRGPSPAQLLETWKASAEAGRLHEPATEWPDFRRVIDASKRRDRNRAAVEAGDEYRQHAERLEREENQR
ncbi:MAG: hypothetical protein ACOC00_00040 [Halothiobacillaceae bacterium]